MKIYGAIQKYEEEDDGTIRIHGIASTEDRDTAGEIIRATAMRNAIPGYSVYPTLREMHGLSAAGTTVEMEVDADGITRIVGHVVDPVAIKKVKTNVYRGLSIGGKVLKRDPNDRSVITEIDLREISLVDRPCNSACSMSLIKVGGLDETDEEDQLQGAEINAPEADVEDQKNAAAQIETTPQTQEGAPAPSGAQSMTTKASTKKAADKVEKAIEPAPISASQVGDVMNDGAGNGDATGIDQPVAGKKITPPALPDGGAAVSTEVKNPEEAGQATPAPLGQTPVAPVEHVAGETPKPGTDTRTRKEAAAEGEAVSGDSTDGQETIVEKADPVAAARAAADQALKAATAVMQSLAKRSGEVPTALQAGLELRKGLPATARLGYVLQELAYCLYDAQMEKAIEGDDSQVPEKLHAALESLGAAYKAMSDEELQELLAAANTSMATEIALAAASGDLHKALEGVVGEDALAKLASDDEGEALAKQQAVNEDLLKTVGSLTETLTALTAKVEHLENQPMPPKTVAIPAGVQSLSKADDTTSPSAAAAPAASTAPSEEDVAKALAGMSEEDRAMLIMKASLSSANARLIKR